MREALSSLTPRGRMLLAGGVTGLVCGMALGMPALVRVGLFCALLPLFVALAMSWARYRLRLEREVTPVRVPCGQSATVRLRLVNEGLRPPGSVLVEDEVGYALGARPRFRLEALSRGREHVHEYRVSSDVRGAHRLGPARLAVSDALGLVEVLRQFRSTSTLVVLPEIVPLTSTSGASSASSGSRGHAAAPLLATDDATVRAYRRGDDVRRVHWRSSARLGELMVRHEDLPHRPASTVLLDVRHGAHRGTGAASSLEAAVRAAASLLVHLHHEGHDLQVVAGTRRAEVSTQDAEALGRALDMLAGVGLEEARSLPLPGADLGAGGRAVVAVLGRLTEADTPALAAWSSHSATARALVLDVERWAPGARRRPSGDLAGGTTDRFEALPSRWARAGLGPRTDLDTAWRATA